MPSPDVILLTEEAKKYLLPTRADVERASPVRRKAVAAARAFIDGRGGFEAAMPALVAEDKLAIPSGDLREAFLFAEADVRARCEAIAATLWTSANRPRRERLLWCFSDRSDWAAELAREVLQDKPHAARDLLLSTLADPELLVAIADKSGLASCVINIVPRLGGKAAGVLGAMLDHERFPNEEKALSRALGCIGTAEAAAIFVKHLRKKNVRPYATAFFAAFPHLAKDALSDLAAKKTQVAEIARAILTSVERATTAAEGASAGASGAEMIDEATEEELPLALREPPWMRKKRLKEIAVPTIPGLEVPLEPLALRWTDRWRRQWIAQTFFDDSQVVLYEAELRTLEENLAAKKRTSIEARHPARIAIPLLRERPDHVVFQDRHPPMLLALHGAEALEPVVAHHAHTLDGLFRMFVESPRIAATLAERHLSLTFRRQKAVEWLLRFPRSAALGLVPAALGENPKARAGGLFGLHCLHAHGHRSAIEAAAATFGALVGEAIGKVLEQIDRWVEGPKSAPKLPSIYRVGELRRPRLLSGKVLSASATERLDQLLKASSLELPVTGLAEVRAACEPRSLAEHAWDLAKAWDINGAKEGNLWMLHAIAHIGDDEVVRRLTPALKGEGIASMLGVIGTDAALMELVTIRVRASRAGKGRLPKYAHNLGYALGQIAAKRGTTVDELTDHFVPTSGVDPAGGIALDVGDRAYRLTFDAQLARILLDPNGEKVKSLPRAGIPGVDPDKLAAATTLLVDVDEDVGAIAELRAASLERAMLDGRAWSFHGNLEETGAYSQAGVFSSRPGPNDFASVWVNHPLMKSMARGVVWEARANARTEASSAEPSGTKRLGTFRIAEDGSFANADDEPFALPPETTSVGVAHLLRYDAETRARWRQIFADYEVLQPFDQLGREPIAIEDKDLERDPVALQKPAAPAEEYVGLGERLERVGWQRSAWGRYAFPLEDGSYACVRLVTSGPAGRVVEGSIFADQRWVPLAAADPIARTELVRALEILAGER